MNDQKTHRPIWRAVRGGLDGGPRREFCTRCGGRRGERLAHPVHYAVRDERGAWAIYCARYGEATATGLDFATADRYAKRHEDGSDPCGCEAWR